MSASPIFDLRTDELPPGNDWDQLLMTLYKKSTDRSRCPWLTALLSLRDSQGTVLGVVGPPASESESPDGLELYAMPKDVMEDGEDEGVTSSQSVARRGWRAEEAEIRILRSLYRWDGDRSVPPNVTQLRATLYSNMEQFYRQNHLEQEARETGPWQEVQTILSTRGSDRSRVLYCRDRNTAYTHLLLVRRMVLSTLPPSPENRLLLSHVKEKERELLEQLKKTRSEEARLHRLSTLSRCQTEHSPCKLESHEYNGGCAAFVGSVRSLEFVPLLTELDLSAAI